MLERRSKDGVVWYESPRLAAIGVRHAFSTRIGGVSTGVFASLNLGNPSGVVEQDTRANIVENERRVMAAAGLEPERRELCRVHQVHGCDVAIVRTGENHDGHAKADALVATDAARVLSVRTADCVPVLLASEDGRTVAAVHAGWRGVVADVVGAAWREVQRLGVTGIIAAIGPSIGEDAFEVDGDVASEFLRALDPQVADCPVRSSIMSEGSHGKWHIDLKRAIEAQLRTAGCGEIDTTTLCTVREKELFFSHRREKGVTGRMAAFVAARSEEQASSDP